MIFVGLERGAHAACLWDKSTNRILVSGDVKYNEDVFPAALPSHPIPAGNPTHIVVHFPDPTDSFDPPSFPETSLTDPHDATDLLTSDNTIEATSSHPDPS